MGKSTPVASLDEVLLRYRDSLTRREFSVQSTKLRLKHLRNHLQRLSVDPFTVTHDELTRYLKTGSQKWSFAYFKKILAALRDFYTWCYDCRVLGSNISATLPTPAQFVEPERVKVLSPVLCEYGEYLVVEGLAERSRAARVADIERLGKRYRLFEITALQLVEYVSNPDWSVYYRRKVRASVRKFYNWAFETGRMQVNLAEDLPQIKGRPPQKHAITEEALQEAFDRAPLQVQAMIALGGSLGLRRSEIASLHARHRTGNMLRVVGKGRVERNVPLNDLTLGLLRRLEKLNGLGYYFPNPHRSGHITGDSVYRQTKPYIGDWSFHSLRHRTATVALNEANSIRVVQEILGHTSVATTQIYTEVTFAQLQQLVNTTDWQRNKGAAETGAGESVGEILQGLDAQQVEVVRLMAQTLRDQNRNTRKEQDSNTCKDLE